MTSDNQRGAALMTAAMAGFACSDACMKLLGETLPLFQALFLRGCGTTLGLGLLALALGQLRAGLPPGAAGIVAARAVAEMGAAWFFITALFEMPLANISAVLQSLPLLVTLAGWLVLGEPVGRARLLAILAGLGGVLLILRPGAEGFGWPAAYAMASVLCVTVRDLLARRLPGATPSVLVAFLTAGAVAAFAGAGSLFVDWAPVRTREGLLLLGAMGFVMGAYVASVATMRVGDLGFVAPFRYMSLLVSLLLGAAVFGTFPDGLTLIGAGIVVGTGLFTLLRERARARVPEEVPPGA